MEFRGLRAFQSVAESGSFSAAARRLGYAQSSVTTQVKALEDELGQPLFDRLGRRVALTGVGQRFKPYADQLLALAQAAETDIRQAGPPRGSLTVGCAEVLCTYRLPVLLRRFRQLYPQVELVLAPGQGHGVRPGLASGRMDLALFMDEPVQAADWHVQALCPEEAVLVAEPGDPLAALPRVDWADLAGMSLLVSDQESRYRHSLAQVLADRGVRPGGLVEFHSVEALKQCAVAGCGAALLPRVAAAAELMAGQLKALAWPGLPTPLCTQLAYHRDKWLTPAMGAFVALAGEVLAAPPATGTAHPGPARRGGEKVNT